jgi:dihydropyrimidinase
MLQMLIRNGRCVNAGGQFKADIAIQDGKIAEIKPGIDRPAETVIDAEQRLVLPGVIDAHVHFPWPSENGNSVDDFDSGSKAAVCGGVTTLIEYMVPDRSGSLIPSFKAHLKEAEATAYTDFGFHMVLRSVTEQTIEEMAEMVKRGVTSFKIFGAYEGYRLGDLEILTALEAAKKLGAMVCFHAENGYLIDYKTRRLGLEHKTAVEYFPEAHPVSGDLEALRRIIVYAHEVGARIHIAHVNNRKSLQIIQKAKMDGIQISGETCPQYLMFNDAVYQRGLPEAAYFVLSPAIRNKIDQESLWNALEANILQVVATDHCPYTAQQKLDHSGDFRQIPGGAGGVETSLSLLYSYGVRENHFPLERLVALTSSNPAKIFNLYPRKGMIAVGSDADFVIYNENGESTIDHKKLHSRSDYSIYQGIKVLGKPEITILRGMIVAKDGEVVSKEPGGQYLPRQPQSSTVRALW